MFLRNVASFLSFSLSLSLSANAQLYVHSSMRFGAASIQILPLS